MPALHIPHAANIVDASLGTAAFVATSGSLRCRLITSTTPSTGTTAGSELATSQGYTGGASAPTVTFAAASTTTGQAVSSSAVTVSNMPASTIGGVELWDSGGTPARKWWGTLTGGNKVVASGDTFTIAAGSLTATLT